MGVKPENVQIIRKHLLALLKPVCANCGSCFDLELDHIQPLQMLKEERNNWNHSARIFEWITAYDCGNLQVLCSECNKKKGDN